MGWNLEVACIRHTKGSALSQIVPDVFTSTGDMVGFEDATSASRGSDLSAAIVGKWAVLIDVACRLSGAIPWLEQASDAGDLFLVCVAVDPVALHYREGKPVAEHRGVGECNSALGRAESKPGDWIDGEQLACDLIKTWTGLNFPNKLWKARFELFSAD